MATKILVPHGMRGIISLTMGLSAPTVRRALAGYDDTDTMRRIRCFALHHGGVEVKDDTTGNSGS